MRHVNVAFYLILLPLSAMAATYPSIIADLSEAPTVKAARYGAKAAVEQAKATEAKRLPSLDVQLQAVHLNETPTMFLHFPVFGNSPSALPMGTRDKFVGEVRLRYPIFTGFALSALTDKSRWEAQKARLQVLNAQRNLAWQATRIFGTIQATRHTLLALQKAKKASQDALKKAQGMYDAGLLPPADLANIQAQNYAVKANIAEAKDRIDAYLRDLSRLLGKPIRRLQGTIALRPLPSLDRLERLALKYRSDVQALRVTLQIDDNDIRLAQSKNYPTLAAATAIKRQGDTLALNGDGFTNADQSYIGLDMRWNLFSGGSTRHRTQAARYKKLADNALLDDYEARVRTEIRNAYFELQTLRTRLRSQRARLKAQRDYFRLTKGRFAQRLASADELSRAIADFAQAEAQVGALKTQIDVARAKVWLLCGVKPFMNALKQ